MKKILNLICSAAAALMISGTAMAADMNLPPEQLVESVSVEVLEQIKKDPELSKADPMHVNRLVDENILPYTDFETMTRMAVGPSWRKTTAEERKEIMTSFRKLLTNVYSGALKEASGYSVKMGTAQKGGDPRLVIVRTQLVSSSHDPIKLDYRLMDKNGQWKIFDVNVGGVWLVENYRSQFASVISNSGIKGLIAQLNERASKVGTGK